MTNLNIHKFSVDQASGNVESVTFVRDDGTLQTFSDADVNNVSLEVSENGTYTPPEPFTGFDEITVNVPPSGKLETIDIEVNTNAQTIRPDVGFDGIGEIRVPKTTLESKSVLLTPDNKTYVAAEDGYFGFSQVTVPGYSSLVANLTTQDLEDAGIGLGLTQTVTPSRIYGPDTPIKGFSSFQIPPAILQAKEVTLSTSEQVITPTDGAYGLSEVVVPSVYEVFTDEITITANADDITPPSPYLGFGKVNVRVPVPRVQDETNIPSTINTNGNYTFTPGTGYDATKKVLVSVNVPHPVVQNTKNIGTITENGAITITPDSGYDAMGQVTGTVAIPLPSLQNTKTATITTNNSTTTISPDSPYDAMRQVVVETHIAQGNIQASKSVTYTTNDTYHIYPDAGYDGLLDAQVTVNVPNTPPTYYVWTLYLYGGGPEILLFNDNLTTRTSIADLSVGDTIKAFCPFYDSGGNKYYFFGCHASDFGMSGEDESGTALYVESIDPSTHHARVTSNVDPLLPESSDEYYLDLNEVPAGPYSMLYFVSDIHGTGT